jgi:hypothetical protein
MGYRDDTFYVAPGYHTIEVDFWLEGWFFYYWDTSGGHVYTDPLELTISSATTVTAEYCTGYQTQKPILTPSFLFFIGMTAVFAIHNF